MDRIYIRPGKGSQGLTNSRIKAYFKVVFGEEPTMIRCEGRYVIAHTDMKLKEKQVRKFASKLGNFQGFVKTNESYLFNL